MRLLHTSDWHLGRTLHGHDLLEAQRTALDRIVEVAREHDVAAVLLSGDVYDRSVPPVEAVKLLNLTLRRLAEFTQVIVSSGNHDSASRLGFGADLFVDRLHVRTQIERIVDPVVLTDEFGPVLVYVLPFLDPDDARHKLGGDEPLPRSHEAVVAAAMDLVRADVERRSATQGERLRSVVLAHAFVAGAAAEPVESHSERDVRVGGVSLVPADVFAGITYTALGHLHRAQEPTLAAGRGYVRYSGSPLRYSFSEAGHDKSVTIVELGKADVESATPIPLPQPRDMAQIEGPLHDLLESEAYEPDVDKWVKAVVTDLIRPDGMYDRIKQRFPHALTVVHVPPASSAGVRRGPAGEAVDPLQILRQFLTAAVGEPDGEADAAQFDLLQGAFEAVVREERV